MRRDEEIVVAQAAGSKGAPSVSWAQVLGDPRVALLPCDCLGAFVRLFCAARAARSLLIEAPGVPCEEIAARLIGAPPAAVAPQLATLATRGLLRASGSVIELLLQPPPDNAPDGPTQPPQRTPRRRPSSPPLEAPSAPQDGASGEREERKAVASRLRFLGLATAAERMSWVTSEQGAAWLSARSIPAELAVGVAARTAHGGRPRAVAGRADETDEQAIPSVSKTDERAIPSVSKTDELPSPCIPSPLQNANQNKEILLSSSAVTVFCEVGGVGGSSVSETDEQRAGETDEQRAGETDEQRAGETDEQVQALPARRPRRVRVVDADVVLPPGGLAERILGAIVGNPVLAQTVASPRLFALTAAHPGAYPGVDVVAEVCRAGAHEAATRRMDGSKYLANWLRRAADDARSGRRPPASRSAQAERQDGTLVPLPRPSAEAEVKSPYEGVPAWEIPSQRELWARSRARCEAAARAAAEARGEEYVPPTPTTRENLVERLQGLFAGNSAAPAAAARVNQR